MAYLFGALFTVFAAEMYLWITHNFNSGANSNNPPWGSVSKWILTWQAWGSGVIFGRSLCIKIVSNVNSYFVKQLKTETIACHTTVDSPVFFCIFAAVFCNKKASWFCHKFKMRGRWPARKIVQDTNYKSRIEFIILQLSTSLHFTHNVLSV